MGEVDEEVGGKGFVSSGASPIGFFEGLETLDPLMERARAVATRVAGSALERVAQAFIANTETSVTLLGVPIACVSAGYIKAMDEILAGMESGAVGAMLEQGADPHLANGIAKGLMEAVKHVQGRVADRTRAVLGALATSNEPVARTFQALARAAVAQAWTSFECVAVDSWVAALDADPRFGQTALAAPAPAGTPQELSNKSIPIWLLGKFGFDLRNKMGTVLREKFHFGKLSGAREAYAAAFGKKATVLAALDNRDLLRLEATRHLVVHRGGVIDDDYRRITGSQELVGTSLALSGPQIAPLITAGASASCAILDFVATLACGKPRPA